MSESLEQVSPTRVKLTVTVAGKELVKYFEHTLEKLGQNVELPGFRAGKAPQALLIEHLGHARIQQHVLEHAIPEAYYKAIQTNKLQPIQQPAVSIHQHGDFKTGSSDLVFAAEVDILPPIKVVGWKTIRLPKARPLTVTAEEVDKALEFVRNQRAQFHSVSRAAHLGDRVEISFSGMLEGVPNPDLQSKRYPVILGSKSLVPGFEEQLVSMEGGQEKTFTLTFPKDYPRASFRDKEASFTVSIEAVQEVVVPPLDDHLAQELDAKTVSELRAKIKTQIEKEKALYNEHAEIETLLEKIQEKVQVELPEGLINQEKERLRGRLAKQLAQRNQTLEQYLALSKKKPQDFEQDLLEQARRTLKISLGLRAIAQEEGITITKEEDSQKVIQRILKTLKKG